MALGTHPDCLTWADAGVRLAVLPMFQNLSEPSLFDKHALNMARTALGAIPGAMTDAQAKALLEANSPEAIAACLTSIESTGVPSNTYLTERMEGALENRVVITIEI